MKNDETPASPSLGGKRKEEEAEPQENVYEGVRRKDELWRRVFMRYLNIEKSTYTHLMPAELYGIQKMVHMSYRNKS